MALWPARWNLLDFALLASFQLDGIVSRHEGFEESIEFRRKYMSLSEPNRISKFLLDHAPRGIDVAAALFIQFVFWIGILRYIELPGLHHDAINPDYIAARTINDQLYSPGGALFTAWFPLLGNRVVPDVKLMNLCYFQVPKTSRNPKQVFNH